MREGDILTAVRAAVARGSQRVAIIAGEQTLTYAGLEHHAAAVSTSIAGQARGEIVGLLLANTPAFASSLLGAFWAGKTVAVLPTLAPPPLLGVMIAEAELQTVLTSPEFVPRLAGTTVTPLIVDESLAATAGSGQPVLAARANPAAVLLYTSGTTGRPKAVALSDQNILSNADGSRQAAGFGSDDVTLAILPFFHAYGLTITLILPLALGGTVVLLERFSPRNVLEAIKRHRVTSLVAVPSQYRLLVKEPSEADTHSLRFAISGAERLPDQVAQGFEDRFGLPLLPGYGATEAAPVISLNAPHAHRPGTVGRPLPNLRVTLRDDGRALAAGESGEIWVEGPSVMLGYHNRPEATAEKLVGGALRTGDLGFLDPEGYLHLAGRADDLLKIAGEKIYPAEVERAIEQIDGVEEAVVLGMTDEKHGMALRAFVEPKPGASLEESSLRAACRERIEAIKVPRSLVIVEQFPRTATGKVDKRKLATQVGP